MMIILEAVDSMMFSGDIDGMAILEYAYITTTPITEAMDAKDDWQSTVMQFGDTLSLTDYTTASETLVKTFEEISEATVETKESGTKKK